MIDQGTHDLITKLQEDADKLAGVIVIAYTEDGAIRALAAGAPKVSVGALLIGTSVMLQIASGVQIEAPRAAPNSNQRRIILPGEE